MERRSFIKNSVYTTAAASVLNSSFAKPTDKDKKLFLEFENNNNTAISEEEFLADDSIVIILDFSGGNDGLNTVVPVFDDNYHKLRPRIRIAEEDAVRFGSSNLYLHPALSKNSFAGGFLNLLDRGNLAVIENVGYENPTMSHFRSADIWESGIITLDPKFSFNDGWLGRFFANKMPSYPNVLPPHPLAISLEGKVPLVFRSGKGNMGISMNNPENLKNFGNGLTPVENLLQTVDRYSNEYNFIHSIARQSELYSSAVYNAYSKGYNELEYQGDNLGNKFKLIAKLISGGLKTKAFFIRIGGFDSHVQQMREVLAGQHPQLLQSISDSITRFVGDATAQGFMNRVTILTTSEFGRRPADNGSKGSDHGAASSIFLVSHFDNITGGRIGDPPDLSNLDNNGNLGAEFDFRRIYADILRVWFRATAEEVTEVFGEEILPIGVLKPRIINSVFQTTPIKDECLVYPNPNYGSAKFKFKLTENSVIDLKIFRINGTKYSDLYNGYLYSGENSFDINIKESGNFIINIQLANQTINTKFTVY